MVRISWTDDFLVMGSPGGGWPGKAVQDEEALLNHAAERR
jgi:hypothetical protein